MFGEQTLQSFTLHAAHVQYIHCVSLVEHTHCRAACVGNVSSYTITARVAVSESYQVSRRPGLHVESSDFLWTQFLEMLKKTNTSAPCFLAPENMGLFKQNWYILVLLLFELTLLPSCTIKCTVNTPKDIKSSALTLSTQVLTITYVTGLYSYLYPSTASNTLPSSHFYLFTQTYIYSPQTTETALRTPTTFSP